MLDAYEGCLHLYRLDAKGDYLLELGATCTAYDTYALCSLLTWGGVPDDTAVAYAKRFSAWWDANDVGAMVEDGADGELRDALEPFRRADVCAEIIGLRWELG